MGKIKTHSGAKKRFHVTGTGKVTFQKCGRRHLMKTKNGNKLRHMRSKGILKGAYEDRMKAALPYA